MLPCRVLRTALFTAALMVPVAAHADVAVEGPFARATAGVGKIGAAFMTLKNTGSTDDALLSATSPVAGRVELHTHITEGDVKRMRQVETIPVPAGKTVALEPGGLHLMLIDLLAPLKEGQAITVDLTFANAGKKSVSVSVQAPAAMAPMQHGHGTTHTHPK